MVYGYGRSGVTAPHLPSPFFAIRPFEQGVNHEVATENTKSYESHEGHNVLTLECSLFQPRQG